MKKRLAKGAAVLLLLLALMPVLPGCNGGEADPVQGEEPSEDRELLQDVQDGRPCEWTLSIQVDGKNVTFKAQSEDGQQSPEEGLS